MKTAQHLLILVLIVLATITSSVSVQAQRDCFNGYYCLDLVPLCERRWQIVNYDPNWEGSVMWQIWSAYEYSDPADAPIILYEGTVSVPAPRSSAQPVYVTFETPVGRPTIIVRGPMAIDDGPVNPSTAPCDVPPPRACTDVFKIVVPPELRSADAQFVIYHVGDVFLEEYSDGDLGFDIQMGAINPATGQVALLLCKDAWPGNLNFVGMVEADGSRTPIIEFTLGATWPDVQVHWTAPGVENAI